MGHWCDKDFTLVDQKQRLLIKWLDPSAGKMSQILCCNWLAERDFAILPAQDNATRKMQ